MRKMTEKEELSWDARRVGEFGPNRPTLAEVTARRHAKKVEEHNLLMRLRSLSMNPRRINKEI